jgi:hypothetical protein
MVSITAVTPSALSVAPVAACDESRWAPTRTTSSRNIQRGHCSCRGHSRGSELQPRCVAVAKHQPGPSGRAYCDAQSRALEAVNNTAIPTCFNIISASLTLFYISYVSATRKWDVVPAHALKAGRAHQYRPARKDEFLCDPEVVEPPALMTPVVRGIERRRHRESPLSPHEDNCRQPEDGAGSLSPACSAGASARAAPANTDVGGASS